MPGTITDVGRTLINFRLTDQARALILEIARRRGISQAAVVEQAIRDYAEALGVRLPEPAPDAEPPKGGPTT